MIYYAYISELLRLKESLRQNLYSLNISEHLSLIETPKNNYHFCNISDKLILSGQLIINQTLEVDVSESLSLKEKLIPRVYQCDITDVIAIGEYKANNNFVEKLHLRETITYSKYKAILDALLFVETIITNTKIAYDITEALNVTEGVTCIKIVTDRPCLSGDQVNTKSITLSTFDSRYSVTVMSPDFENTESPQYTRVNKTTRGGDLIIFRDSQWPKTLVLSYSWSNLLYNDRVNLMNFIINTVGQIINLLDYEGVNHSVYIKNPDADFTLPVRHSNHVKLEFEEQ